MAMYALAVKPLICKLKQDVPEVKQVWYADDAAWAGSCSKLRLFWDRLSDLGKVYGYYPNPSKTHLIVKEQFLQKANEVFAGTGINVTTNGQRHLGAAIGKRSSVEEYVKMKVSQWTTEVRQLADIAKTQPQAAYSAYVHGLSSRWIFLSLTILNISHLLEPVEVALQQDFIPALTGRHACSREERELLALQVRLGGLGIQNPAIVSESAFEASLKLTSPLVQAILTQDPNLQVDLAEVISIKDAIRKSNQELRAAQAMTVHDALPSPLQRCVELAREKGASSWLSVLPIKDQGFSLNKGEFRDALCLRYGWSLTRTPTHCNCGRIFTTDHSMICPKGGFPTIRHNELRDMTANLLTEVCHNVATEPHLQPL